MTSALLFPEMAELPGLFDAMQALSDKYRPSRIEDFAGLGSRNGEAGVKAILTGFVANPRAPGLLFVGAAGTGKTSMGIALARELRGFLHHVQAGECTVDRIRELAFTCHYMPPAGFNRHVILIDEVDAASYNAQVAMLPYLDGTATIPCCTWVFTCNALDKLHERFTSRNKVLTFSTYGIQADAAKLLERVWQSETDAPAPNFAGIIKAQNGNIRAALDVLDSKLVAVKERAA